MSKTQRPYYDDAYTTEFSARVVERLTAEGQPVVALDQTYFYPTGGGQPCDTGTIGGVGVLDVYPREGDGAVLHALAGEVGADEVACRVDWARRFDHMQHHTGQHILSQAFIQVADAHTVGFHLSADSVTIDLDVAEVTPETLEQTEDLANRVIFENRPVTARLLEPGEETQVRMRKMPDTLSTGRLRIIEVEDFDTTACGGTHVARTGEIGLVKVLKLERRGETTRVEFRCGDRAVRDYRAKNAIANQLAAELTVGYWELGEAVERLRDELKDTRRALNAARTQLMDGEVTELLATAAERDGLRLVKRAYEDRDAGELRELVSRLVAEPDVIALLGAAGQKAQLIVAHSEGIPHDVRDALKRGLEVLGSDRGGGRPEFAQGGGVAADLGQVQAALDEAERVLFGS